MSKIVCPYPCRAQLLLTFFKVFAETLSFSPFENSFIFFPFSIRFPGIPESFPSHSRTIIDTSILSEPQKRSFILRVACPQKRTRFKGLLARAIHSYYLSIPHTYAYRNSYLGAKIRINFYLCKYISHIYTYCQEKVQFCHKSCQIIHTQHVCLPFSSPFSYCTV